MFLRLCVAVLLSATSLFAVEDPLAAPEEVRAFARRAAGPHNGFKPKLQGILDGIFRSPEQGGLGITYDNTYTRTVAEVWKDRKANCLSLTAFFVASCEAVGLQTKFAEALNTNRWRRVGSIVRFERHLVGLFQLPPTEDLVADFLPQLRKKMGFYRVNIIGAERVRALFYANRAVELMEKEQSDESLEMANLAVETDPQLSIGWNILGVVHKTRGQPRDAEAMFLKALHCDPMDSVAIGNMEALLREMGRLEEAQRYRILGHRVRQKDPFFHAFLAEEAIREGNTDEAQKRIRSALKLLPREPEFHLLQARVHILEGKVDAAVKDLEEAQHWAVPEERERWDGKLAAIREQQKGRAEESKPK
jgi:Flp pilus assembly protein TadD